MSTETVATRTKIQPVGVPRRFGAGTLLIVVAVYGALFRLLTFLGADSLLFGIIVLFTTSVAAGQAILFGGRKPRDASFLAGSLLCPSMLLAQLLMELLGWSRSAPPYLGIDTIPQLLSALVYLALFGSVLGYFAGCSAAGVFFVTDRIKRRWAMGVTRVADDLPSAIPSGLERIWQRVLVTIRRLSPFQRDRPVPEAVNVFILSGTFMGLAVPYVTWLWQPYALVVVTVVALILAFWHAGVRLCGWKLALLFLILGCVGALVPGTTLRRLYLLGRPIEESVPQLLVISALAGCLIGMTVAAARGWVGWLLRRGGKKQQCRALWTPTLVAATALVVLYSAITFWFVRMSQRPEQRAIASIVKRGGGVGFSPNSWIQHGPPVRFWMGDAQDADLRQLHHFPELVFVSISGGAVSDGLACVRSLPLLQHLYLYQTSVSDRGLKHLEGHVSLRHLKLSNSAITDAGLQSLAKIKGLTVLYLADTQISDSGLKTLGEMTGLSNLSVANTQVTDQGLKHLKTLNRLRFLSLSGTQVTDAGLVHLKGLTWLEGLILDNTPVTDAGLVQLQGLKKLQQLDLNGTRVTGAGLRTLRQSLMPCRITADAGVGLEGL